MAYTNADWVLVSSKPWRAKIVTKKQKELLYKWRYYWWLEAETLNLYHWVCIGEPVGWELLLEGECQTISEEGKKFKGRVEMKKLTINKDA